MRLHLIAVAIAAACYSPAYKDCEITCATGECPSGLECIAGRCRTSDHQGTCGGSDSTDAKIDDAASDTQQLACPYTSTLGSDLVSCPGTAAGTCASQPNAGTCCWGINMPRECRANPGDCFGDQRPLGCVVPCSPTSACCVHTLTPVEQSSSCPLQLSISSLVSATCHSTPTCGVGMYVACRNDQECPAGRLCKRLQIDNPASSPLILGVCLL